MIHASLATLRAGGAWRGALLLGPSGAGKSDLLLRLADAGFRLVADDRVRVWASGGRAWGRAPDALAGLVELRGQGMAAATPLPFARLVLAAELGAADERQPEPAWCEMAGVRLPLHRLAPLEASAPARLRRLLAPAGLAGGRA